MADFYNLSPMMSISKLLECWENLNKLNFRKTGNADGLSTCVFRSVHVCVLLYFTRVYCNRLHGFGSVLALLL